MGSTLSLTGKNTALNEPISSNELNLIKLSWEAIPNKEDFGKKNSYYINSRIIFYLFIFFRLEAFV